MKNMLFLVRPLVGGVLVFDAFLLMAAAAYAGVSPAPLELQALSGVFAFFALLAVAFCQQEVLRRNLSVFSLCARLPLRYDRFLLVFLGYFSGPLLLGFAWTAFLLSGLKALHLLPPGAGLAVRCLQSLFALVLIKLLSLHLLLMLQRGAAWIAAYFTFQIAALFALILLKEVLRFPDEIFAALFLVVQALLIVYSVRRGFHRVL